MKTFYLKLFVGNTGKKNEDYIEKIHLACKREGVKYKLDVINVVEAPEKAEKFKILATPTLIREIPKPSFRLVGKINNIRETVLIKNLE